MFVCVVHGWLWYMVLFSFTHIHMCMLHCARTPLMMHSFYDGPGVFVMQKKCVHDVVRAIVMETRMCVQCMAVSAHVSLSHVPHDSQC